MNPLPRQNKKQPRAQRRAISMALPAAPRCPRCGRTLPCAAASCAARQACQGAHHKRTAGAPGGQR